MNDLKTLKDLENGFSVVGIRELRAEAIKWAKEFNHEHKGKAEDGAIEFIKSFFNLTEEDLK